MLLPVLLKTQCYPNRFVFPRQITNVPRNDKPVCFIFSYGNFIIAAINAVLEFAPESKPLVTKRLIRKQYERIVSITSES